MSTKGPKRLTLTALPEHEGKRLDHVLAEWLPQALNQPVSKGQVRKLVVAGAVYLNGSRVRIASKSLRARAKVEVYVDLAKLGNDATRADRIFEMSSSDILFEDEFLIAVNKPPGLPTQPTLDEARDNLFAAVKKFLKVRDSQPDPYLGLHHRLDRDTSGVILFTKKTEANTGVAELFSARKAQKIYHALSSPSSHRVSEPLDGEFEIKNYLGPNRTDSSSKRGKFTAVTSGGDFAHTSFRVLEKMPAAVLVEASPHTGRTHQIRVHLAERGFPILGDATYGGNLKLAPRLMLHAVSLTFPHPIHQTQISIRSPLPKDFTECLKKLKDQARP
jgi:23S rRNA pseudouridine1911/1915/1917 synthase